MPLSLSNSQNLLESESKYLCTCCPEGIHFGTNLGASETFLGSSLAFLSDRQSRELQSQNYYTEEETEQKIGKEAIGRPYHVATPALGWGTNRKWSDIQCYVAVKLKRTLSYIVVAKKARDLMEISPRFTERTFL